MTQPIKPAAPQNERLALGCFHRWSHCASAGMPHVCCQNAEHTHNHSCTYCGAEEPVASPLSEVQPTQPYKDLSRRQQEMPLVELNLRRRIHNLEQHNQYFFRCESGWCNPSEDCDPSKEQSGDRFSAVQPTQEKK